MEAVPSRKLGDCILPALATALGKPYETIAGWLGIKLSDDGIPRINESGIAFNHVVYPLWRQGIVAAHLVSTRHPRAADLARCPEITLPSPADLAAILRARRP